MVFQSPAIMLFTCRPLVRAPSHEHRSDRFVPSKVPTKRRIQTLAVFTWSSTMFICCAVFLYLWYGANPTLGRDPLNSRSFSSFPPLWPFLVAYMFWVLVIDKSPVTGGRSSEWFRGMRFWRYFSEYYPASYVSSFTHCNTSLFYLLTRMLLPKDS